ncbi:MAG: bifunctional phosphoglucose/phosphomannose isomerase [Methanobacterium sp.]
MRNLIEQFPKQIEDAFKICKKQKFVSYAKKIDRVIICGVGGSGICGNIAQDLFFLKSKVPITVVKGYHIPGYVNETSLVIIISYSGNTEETVSNLKQAIKRRAKIVGIFSEGTLEHIFQKRNFDYIKIPDKLPPGAAIAHTMISLMFCLINFKVVSGSIKRQIYKVADFIKLEETIIISLAKSIASKIRNKIPIIYSTSLHEGIAVRFKQQLNENSKILCWNSVIPDTNHNELAGWTKTYKHLAVIFISDFKEYHKNTIRINFTKELLGRLNQGIINIFFKGENEIEKIFYMIHLCDWISFFIAEEKGISPVEVNIISSLKYKLSQ